jgi:ATP-dependent Clp protease ATP-binding subunit ClpC
MRQEKYTEQAQEALAASQEMVRGYQHSQWDVEHILMAMLRQEDGLTLKILKELGVDVEALQKKVEAVLAGAPKIAHEGAQIYATPRTINLLQRARAEADRLNDEYIGVDHILIAMAGEH